MDLTRLPRTTPEQHPMLELRRDKDTSWGAAEIVRRCALFTTWRPPRNGAPGLEIEKNIPPRGMVSALSCELNETARFHQGGCRRSRSVAARGTRAAAGDVGRRVFK
jgi:hypothetical protein